MSPNEIRLLVFACVEPVQLERSRKSLRATTFVQNGPIYRVIKSFYSDHRVYGGMEHGTTGMIPPVLQVLSAALAASHASLVPNSGKLNVCATESDLRRALPTVHAALDVHRQELAQLFGSPAEWLALHDLSGRRPSN